MLIQQKMRTLQEPVGGQDDFAARVGPKECGVVANSQSQPSRRTTGGAASRPLDLTQDVLFRHTQRSHARLQAFVAHSGPKYIFAVPRSDTLGEPAKVFSFELTYVPPLSFRTVNRYSHPVLRTVKYRVDGQLY